MNRNKLKTEQLQHCRQSVYTPKERNEREQRNEIHRKCTEQKTLKHARSLRIYSKDTARIIGLGQLFISNLRYYGCHIHDGQVLS